MTSLRDDNVLKKFAYNNFNSGQWSIDYHRSISFILVIELTSLPFCPVVAAAVAGLN